MSKMLNVKTFRLNKDGSSEYAIFVVNDATNMVEYRHFEYYTGPTIEERTVPLDKARAKYAAMLASGWHKVSSTQVAVQR